LSRMFHSAHIVRMVFDMFKWGYHFRRCAALRVTTGSKQIVGTYGGVSKLCSITR
jgi:hypothetical protein